MERLTGVHHVTAITSSAEKIYYFFTYILGLRLVKKTVNQDDIQTYHLFFADDEGLPGTDMTFFDFPNSSKKIEGSDEIYMSGFRVPSDDAIFYYQKRFDAYQVKHYGVETFFGHKVLRFDDFDDQHYILFSDTLNHGVSAGLPWKKGPIPNQYAIYGLGPIFIKVSNEEKMTHILKEVLMFHKTSEEGSYQLFETGKGGHGASVILKIEPNYKQSFQGSGAIHHVAFRVDDDVALELWKKRLNQFKAVNSGLVDRFYFKSLYTRLYPNMLFEFATDGPGFIDDEEDYEHLGEMLALPPKFRHLKKEITQIVRHIDTKRSHLSIKKEYGLQDIKNGQK